jgi:hypothetical protein
MVSPTRTSATGSSTAPAAGRVTATVWPVEKVSQTIRPSANTAPRFTTSQQAMPIAAGSTQGRTSSGLCLFVRSKA